MRISCSTASPQTNSWNPENGGTPLKEIGKGDSGFGKYVFLFRFRPLRFRFFSVNLWGQILWKPRFGQSCGLSCWDPNCEVNIVKPQEVFAGNLEEDMT